MQVQGRFWAVLAIAMAMSGCAQVDRLTHGDKADQGQESAATPADDASTKNQTAQKSSVQGSETKATDAESARGIYGNPPPHSPFSKLKLGMSSKEVSDLIGQPTDQKTYITGKAWIPFYFGSDRSRLEYRYKGQGVLTFAGNGGFSTNYTLSRVIYNPKESGYEH